MELLLLFLAAFLSTTTMTLFSYAISASFRDLYKEPVLLQFVLSQLDIEMCSKTERIMGWLIHYFIGLVFVVGYLIPIELGWYQISWVSGLVFGILIGLTGIIGWKIMFWLSGHEPMSQPLIYYTQLLFAHIIFGITTAAVYLTCDIL